MLRFPSFHGWSIKYFSTYGRTQYINYHYCKFYAWRRRQRAETLQLKIVVYPPLHGHSGWRTSLCPNDELSNARVELYIGAAPLTPNVSVL